MAEANAEKPKTIQEMTTQELIKRLKLVEVDGLNFYHYREAVCDAALYTAIKKGDQDEVRQLSEMRADNDRNIEELEKEICELELELATRSSKAAEKPKIIQEMTTQELEERFELELDASRNEPIPKEVLEIFKDSK